ncbi:MAG: hypothetical protein FJY29_02215 [Betaproteobacteria bacterium]|nr:hypothetical protein [Betaproteobacteria bacterium]
MKNPSAAIDNQRPTATHALALVLSQWLGLRPGHLTTWSMRTFLSFLVVALPPYLLALHYHYSSEGILLSSAVAGCFGALLSWQLMHKKLNPGALNVQLSLLALCCSVYLVMPMQLNVLYALVVTSAFAIYVAQQRPGTPVEGGRSELLLALSPLAAQGMAMALQRTLLLWALLSLVAHALYKLTHIQSLALIPFVSIAVSCAAVQNSWVAKEQQ